ncbi:prephenate dehydratase domain-containing protein [uncultured Roseivirga sp.]|uniref:prephenate dehydratase n=1 Tax=uncultured Roseivirga sp. TaxID=543088 RepID=UPI000D79D064|nr:prephenate dehydratase domain-containing protein [uncultured Roseivirga sp.]PWL27438.1 MAG: hypothetical protein DCO95_16660 [Roseivirga sp. XM-24bin3]
MTDLGLLGPEYTFHDLARRRFLSELKHTYYSSFDEVFNALKSGEIKQALIAVKNSSSGLVNDNLERISSEYHHIETYELPVHLCLGSSTQRTIDKIKKVFSHHMAIKETEKYFSKYHHITFIATSSTAGAVDELLNSKDKTAAVISSKEAIESNKLQLLAENIEDEKHNFTTFYLVTRKP